jgi:hypothetical protein
VQPYKGEENCDAFFKICTIIKLTKVTCKDFFECGKEVSIDGSMIRFKRCFSCKQPVPAKPSAKWRIKMCSLCNCNIAYMPCFSIYTGKEVNPGPAGEDGLTAKVERHI